MTWWCRPFAKTNVVLDYHPVPPKRIGWSRSFAKAIFLSLQKGSDDPDHLEKLFFVPPKRPDHDDNPSYKHQNTIFAAETHSDAGKKIWWWPLESLSKDNIMGGWWWIDQRTFVRFVLHDKFGGARNDFHWRPSSEPTGSLILYTVITIVTWEIFIRSKLVGGVWLHHHHRRHHYYTTD